VNGLARKLSDSDFYDIINDYDIVFLSETWLSNNSHINLDIQGFHSEHLLGNNAINTRKGRYSGGLSLYYKQTLNNHIKIVEKDQHGIMWVKLCKDLFDFQQDVYICNVYIPPNNSNVIDTINFDFIEQIEVGIEKYKLLGKIFISGDLNCRTSNVSDNMDIDIYIDNDVNQQSSSVYITPRANRDHVIDTQGRRLIELCQTTSFVIGNGRLFKDRGIGNHTFHSVNGSSTVDYFLLNVNDFIHVTDFEIL